MVPLSRTVDNPFAALIAPVNVASAPFVPEFKTAIPPSDNTFPPSTFPPSTFPESDAVTELNVTLLLVPTACPIETTPEDTDTPVPPLIAARALESV